MKKFLNSPKMLPEEAFDGLVLAHEEIIVAGPDRKFVRRRKLVPGKVTLVSGGGAGHEPSHLGLVGTGMLDAACAGRIFTSPTPQQILAAVDAVDQGNGVLLIVKNYAGDRMNFEIAREMAGDRCNVLLVGDDAATGPSASSSGRRGLAGTLIIEKILGAAAEAGAGMPELLSLGEALVRRTRSFGVALKSCTIPETGRRNFALAEDEMEIGVGIHGEPGRRRVPFAPAHAIADEMIRNILFDFGRDDRSEAILLINGLGGTSLSELYLMYNELARMVEANGIRRARSLIGSFMTSLDMAGMSATLSLVDRNMLRLWDAPVHTAALRWGM